MRINHNSLSTESLSLLKSYKKYKYTNHVVKKMKEKKITKRQIENTLKNHEIIEISNNNDKKDIRLLLMSNESYKGFNIVVCVSIDNGNIITCYKNKKNDTHIKNREGNNNVNTIINMLLSGQYELI